MKHPVLSLLLLSLLSFPGCVSQRIADRVLRAPRLQQELFPEGWGNVFDSFSKNRDSSLQTVNIPVGDEEMRIQVKIIPPRNYFLEAQYERNVQRIQDEDGYSEKVTVNMSFSYKDGESNSEPFLNSRGTVYVLPGYGTMKEHMLPLGLILAEAGYLAVLVDLRGHGQSEGREISFGIEEIEDLKQVFDVVTAQHSGSSPAGVLGYSYGAVMAIQWAAQDSRIQSVVALAPYNNPAPAVRRFIRSALPQVGKETLNRSMSLVEDRLGRSWEELSTDRFSNQVKQPILFIHGDKDSMSTPKVIEQLSQLGPGLRKTIQILHADHETLPYTFDEIKDPILKWFALTF